MKQEVKRGDCLEIMRGFADKSFDLVLTDPPYGVTNNKWDTKVDLSELFRVGKAVIMTAQLPFAADIISQFRNYFKYDLVWDKVLVTGFMNANKRPLRVHELILVFGDTKYFPQKVDGKPNHGLGKTRHTDGGTYSNTKRVPTEVTNKKHPRSIITIAKPHASIAVHGTQKPVELFEWLIRSFSQEGDTILDPFMGSGTTLVAAKQLNRNAIGIEISPEYCDIARKRLEQDILL